MNKTTIILLSVFGGLILLGLILIGSFVGMYNGLVTLDENSEAAWADVNTQYQRRADLIPNLVETVQGAADFEANTQTQIAELRTAANAAKEALQNAQTTDDQIAAARQIDSVASQFSGLNINVENYPQLQATANFARLQDELAGTENRVAVARTRYNDAVRLYNTKIRTIPTSFVASLTGFDKKTLFEAEDGAENAPEVEFNSN